MTFLYATDNKFRSSTESCSFAPFSRRPRTCTPSFHRICVKIFPKKERERERERNASAFRALSKRGERENKERNKKCIILGERKKKKVLCWFTRGLYSSLFRQKRKTLFPLAFRSLCADISLSPSGCFNIPSSYARENTNKSRRFRKKNARERGFDTWKHYFSRAKMHSRTPRPVRVSQFRSQQTDRRARQTPHRDEKSLNELTFCLSP